MNIRHWPFTKIVLGCATVFLTVFYCVELHLGALELLRFTSGALALWMPLGGWFYLLLRKLNRVILLLQKRNTLRKDLMEK